jgi:tetratricopeptide (TPR) repeat protein
LALFSYTFFRVQDPQSAQKFYMTAIDKFEEALDSNPNNKELLLNVALTWTLALEDEFTATGNTFPASHPAVSKATEYYLRAISTAPKYDSHSLFLYAYFLELCGNYEAAEVRKRKNLQKVNM